MKICRFGQPGQERPGVWLEDDGDDPLILDVRSLAYDIRDIDGFFFERHGLERVAALLRENNRPTVAAADVRLGPPIARPGKIVCLGRNYPDHAREFDAEPPRRPIYFNKAVSALNGPGDPILLPADAGEVDIEAELALVIGRRARAVPASEAWHCIAGYTVFNDVTDRVRQRDGEQWFLGKSCDSFAPLGPFLVTADEVPDPSALRIRSSLNGETLQDDRAGSMIFDIPHIIADLSAAMTLEPGDVIATGTPAGVGSRREPPLTLSDGAQVEISVTGLGKQSCTVSVGAN